MHIKTMRRDDWFRILEKEVIIQPFRWKEIPGKISIIKILRVSEPLFVHFGSRQIKIADEGYSWVQIAQEGQFFWITSMFDEMDRLIQIYIDMTDGNHTDTDDPWFADLYLDFVVHVETGTVMEMDRDELAEAQRSGTISGVQYKRTLQEGEKMRRYLLDERSELIDILQREQKRLKTMSGRHTDTGHG